MKTSKRLSICIVSLESRADYLKRLMLKLGPQVTDEVELLLLTDRAHESIGEKRQRLLVQAVGDYVVSVDDDDLVADDYVAAILAATATDPDCVTFNVARLIDGKRIGYEIRSIVNDDNYDTFGEVMPRRPNHLCPIRRELALQVGFKRMNRGEDWEYAKGIYPLLKSEVRINRELYTYLFRSQRVGEFTNEMRVKGKY